MSIYIVRTVSLAIAFTIGAGAAALAQESETATREAVLEEAQADKVPTLRPREPNKAEVLINKAEDILVYNVPRWHPYFANAYTGGGFSLGLGYAHHFSGYNMIDVRGGYSILGYKRIEAEFTAPHLFNRRGSLSVLGGWREATQVGFYGIGMDTSQDNRTNFDFQQPYGSATFELRPTRSLFLMRGGLELSQWKQRPGEGDFPSVETVYTPQTLPGLGTSTTYVHSQGTLGLDWRTSPGYSRRGGFYGVTLHDYADRDDLFGFRQVDYEVIQHVPVLREAWTLSFRARAQTVYHKDNQEVPFFMLPYVGSGHSLRGFISHRFRDENTVLLQGEWRIMVNRFMDTAVFYDAGKAAARRADLDLKDLEHDYGFGVRFHGPFFTPFRIEVAHGTEGTRLIFATTQVF